MPLVRKQHDGCDCDQCEAYDIGYVEGYNQAKYGLYTYPPHRLSDGNPVSPYNRGWMRGRQDGKEGVTYNPDLFKEQETA